MLHFAIERASVKKMISNAGYKKYTNVKKGSALELNQKAIDKDASWDGFHGIAVSNSANLTVEQALSRYKELWRVEEAFRIAKCTLKTRPIFHWKPHRIRSHVLLCFLTLFIERFLEFCLRQAGTPLTPDRIRHALSGVHTTIFEEKDTNKEGQMKSALSENAQKIFKLLGLPTDRATSLG
jgi:transposase